MSLFQFIILLLLVWFFFNLEDILNIVFFKLSKSDTKLTIKTLYFLIITYIFFTLLFEIDKKKLLKIRILKIVIQLIKFA